MVYFIKMEEINFCISCNKYYDDCICDNDTVDSLSCRNVRNFQIIHKNYIEQTIKEKYNNFTLKNNIFDIKISIVNNNNRGIMLICEKCKELVPHCDVKNNDVNYGMSLISFCPRCGCCASLIISKEISNIDMCFIYEELLNSSLFHYIKITNINNN